MEFNYLQRVQNNAIRMFQERIHKLFINKTWVVVEYAI